MSKGEKLHLIKNDLDKAQGDLNEAIDGMQKNLLKAEKIEDDAREMAGHAKDFENGAKKIKNQFCIRNYKLLLILGGVIAGIILIITLIVVLSVI